jgi:hypothetical protein
MKFITTVGGNQFNPKDLISFLKYKYASDPAGYSQKAGYGAAADKVRSAFGVTDYGKDQGLDPNFEYNYNKIDWGDLNKTVQGWANSDDPNLKSLSETLTPYLSSSADDTGIYKAGDLQTQITNEQAMGNIKSQEAQWQAVLDGDGSSNTIAFLKQNQADSIQSLTDQAALLKKQAEADNAAGRAQVEADYSGIADEILAGVAKLQHMTTDEYAARGMAFSGTLNQAQADIAAAGAAQIGKAMAQKGARLGALTQDLIKYTAQIDLDTLRSKTNLVTQYGLQMAELLDKDASVRNQARAMLAALQVQENTQKTIAPLQSELSHTQADQAYSAQYSKAQQDAEQKSYDRKMAANQLQAQYGIQIDPQTGTFISQSLTPTQKWNVVHDSADLLGQYGIVVNQDKNGNITFTDGLSDSEQTARINAQANLDRALSSGTGSGSGSGANMTISQANSYIKQYEGIQAELSKYSKDANGNWVKEGQPNPAYTAGIQGAPPTIDTPVSADYVKQLQDQLARLEPTYRSAISLRDKSTGASTPLPLSSDERANVIGFINKVKSTVNTVYNANHERLSPQEAAQKLMDQVGSQLTPAEIKAILAYFNDGDTSVLNGGN